jgi:hypothetical protein
MISKQELRLPEWGDTRPGMAFVWVGLVDHHQHVSALPKCTQWRG